VPLADDLLFFILSTRMMPPIAVAIPIYLMFRHLGLSDTKLGMILLYTAGERVAGGVAAQGFHGRESRASMRKPRWSTATRACRPSSRSCSAGNDWHCRNRHLLPDLCLERICVCGPAHQRRSRRPCRLHSVHHRRGRAGLAGGAAATTLFFVPILCFTILLRRHLLRGITFGAVRK
jgi:multiple sugar transport system permease protein